MASVTDTGAGIDPSLRKHLFEPFTTTKAGGTGLGLAASFEIARAHGGDLSFVSSVGTGATFVLKLPLAGERSVTKVLVIDDEAVVREVITAMLAGSGYEVVCASTAAEALELFADDEHSAS